MRVYIALLKSGDYVNESTIVNNYDNEREDYFFDSTEKINDDRVFVLIIYDIISNKKRNKLSKFLLGYGFRIQKSAFEAKLPRKKYNELIAKLPAYVSGEDSIRVYKIIGKGQVTYFGKKASSDLEEVLVL